MAEESFYETDLQSEQPETEIVGELSGVDVVQQAYSTCIENEAVLVTTAVADGTTEITDLAELADEILTDDGEKTSSSDHTVVLETDNGQHVASDEVTAEGQVVEMMEDADGVTYLQFEAVAVEGSIEGGAELLAIVHGTEVHHEQEMQQEVEDGQELQEVEDGQELQEVEDGQELQEVEDGQELQQVEDGQVLQQVEDGQELQQVEDGQELQQVEDGQELQQVEDGQELQQVEDGQVLQQVEDGQELQQVEDGQELQQIEDGQELQQIEDGQELQQMEDGQELQQMEDGQELQQMEDGQELQQMEAGQELQQMEPDQEMEQMEPDQEMQVMEPDQQLQQEIEPDQELQQIETGAELQEGGEEFEEEEQTTVMMYSAEEHLTEIPEGTILEEENATVDEISMPLEVKEVEGVELSEESLVPPHIAPIFKICKVIRHSDGTTECVETNMREIAVADRAVVYRAMMEKFPDIVKQNVTTVQPELQNKKLQDSEGETLEQPVNTPEMVSSTSKNLVSILRKPANGSLAQADSSQPRGSDVISVSSQAAPTDAVVVEGMAATAAASTSPPKFASEPSQTASLSNDPGPTPKQLSRKGNSNRGYRKIAPKPHGQISTSLNRSNGISNSSVTASKLTPGTKSSTTETPHICTAERYFECGGCNNHYKTELEFLKHAAISYLKVSPHLFAENCVIKCILCKGVSPPLADLMEAREHLRQHGNAFTTRCEVCSQQVARDHMYATKTATTTTIGDSIISADDKGSDAADGEILKMETDDSSEKDLLTTVMAPGADIVDNVELVQSFGGGGGEEQLNEDGSGSEAKEVVGPKMYKCRYCDKQFQKRNMCKMHVFAHLGLHPMSCPLCGMTFHRKQSLSLHMQVHMALKPKKEDQEPQPNGSQIGEEDPTGETASNLDLQLLQLPKPKRFKKAKKMTVETDVKPTLKNADQLLPAGPALCELCGLELKNAQRLLQHQYRFHQQPRRRPINKDVTPTACEECGKICRGRSALKSHQRVSCGKKEVLCEICGKMYPAGGRALSNHRYQTHRWRGSNLEKAAWERVKIKKEEGVEEEEEEEKAVGERRSKKPFEPKKCELCGFVATYSTSMRAHLVNKHKYPKIRVRVYNSEPTKCEKCGTVCKGLSALKLHKIRFCLGGKRNGKDILSAAMETESTMDSQGLQVAIEEEAAATLQEQTEGGTVVDILQHHVEGEMEQQEEGEYAEMDGATATANLIIDGNSQLLQFINANQEIDGQTVQFVMGEAEDGTAIVTATAADPDQVAQLETTEMDGSQFVNFYQVLVTNSNGQRVLALVPNIPESM